MTSNECIHGQVMLNSAFFFSFHFVVGCSLSRIMVGINQSIQMVHKAPMFLNGFKLNWNPNYLFKIYELLNVLLRKRRSNDIDLLYSEDRSWIIDGFMIFNEVQETIERYKWIPHNSKVHFIFHGKTYQLQIMVTINYHENNPLIF